MDSISLFAQSPLFSPLAAVLAGVALIGIFWWRAGTIHCVLDRLWRLMAGKTEIQDPALKEFDKRNRDLERFRFVYRLNIATLDDANRLIRWLEEHGLNIAMLQKIRRWVDVNSTDVVLEPPNSYILHRLIAAVLAVFVMATINHFAASNSAFLQMRESKIWFKTDLKTVDGPFDAWSFNLEECEKDKEAIKLKTGFQDSETIAICTSLKDGGLTKIVKKTVKLQRWTGAFTTSAALAIAFFCIITVGAANEARKLRRKLYSE